MSAADSGRDRLGLVLSDDVNPVYPVREARVDVREQSMSVVIEGDDARNKVRCRLQVERVILDGLLPPVDAKQHALELRRLLLMRGGVDEFMTEGREFREQVRRAFPLLFEGGELRNVS